MTFKTRTVKGERYMICRASNPLDKYYKGHVCDNWCRVGKNADAILCYKCTMALTEPPEVNAGYKTKGYPRGWQFKWTEQPELKGTLPVTDFSSKQQKPKLSKREKEELKDQLLQQLIFVRGQLSNSKLKKDINSNRSQLKKIERQIKKFN